MITALLFALATAGAADVAVLPIPQHDALTAAVRAELKGLGYAVQPAIDTERIIGDARALGAACDVSERACALELGGVLGAKLVVVHDGHLELRGFDVTGEVALGQSAARLDRDDVFVARLAVIRLVRPELEVGTLVIQCDVADAVVTVDGKRVGATPLAPQTFTPGRHEVYVAHVDHDSQTLPIVIEFGQTTTLEVTLRPAAAQATQPAPRRDDDEFVTIAVLPPLGFDDGVRDDVAAVLVEWLQRKDGVVVVTLSEVEQRLGADRAAAPAACRSDDCRVPKVGKGLAVDEILITERVVLPRTKKRAVRLRRIGEPGVLSAGERPVATAAAQRLESVAVMAELFAGLTDRPGLEPMMIVVDEPVNSALVGAGLAGGVAALGLVSGALGAAVPPDPQDPNRAAVSSDICLPPRVPAAQVDAQDAVLDDEHCAQTRCLSRVCAGMRSPASSRCS